MQLSKLIESALVDLTRHRCHYLEIERHWLSAVPPHQEVMSPAKVCFTRSNLQDYLEIQHNGNLISNIHSSARVAVQPG